MKIAYAPLSSLLLFLLPSILKAENTNSQKGVDISFKDPLGTATIPGILTFVGLPVNLIGADITLECSGKEAVKGVFEKKGGFFVFNVGDKLKDEDTTVKIEYKTKSVLGLSESTFKNPLLVDFTRGSGKCDSPILTINLENACADDKGVVFDTGLPENTPKSSFGKLEVKQGKSVEGACGIGDNRPDVPVELDFEVGIKDADPRGDLYFQMRLDLSQCNLEKKISILADTDWAKKGECTVTPGTRDDPHFDTFGGQHYDFQGACDLVLVDNAGYKDGKGLFVHGRTALFGSWSSLVSAAVKIGDDVIEVHGEDLALINGVEYTIPEIEGEHPFPMTIGDYSLTVQIFGPHSRRHIIHMGDGEKIFIDNFKEYVNVFLEKPRSNDFELTTGMWGTFGTHGTMMARDGITIIEDGDAFGNEWQVQPTDPQLFHINDGPQYPAKCIMPEKLTSDQRHLRAMSKKVSEDDAKKACSKVSAGHRMQNCIADVFGSDNLDMAGIYAH